MTRLRVTVAVAVAAMVVTGIALAGSDLRRHGTSADRSQVSGAATTSSSSAAPRSAPPPAPSSSAAKSGAAKSGAAKSSAAKSAAAKSSAVSSAAASSNRISAAAAPSGLPVAGAVGRATQVITVAASGQGATRATLRAWSLTPNGWRQTGPAVPAWLGAGGLTDHASENFDGTPIGSFALTQAFGNNPDPGTALPYFQDTREDWWSGDSTSATYNTHQRCPASACRFDTSVSENLYDAGWVYGYAVVIDYNTDPVQPGRGSAFLLHVTQNEPTQGCVSIPQADLLRLLRWLTPSAHPRILMGIG
jgi:L,D-peptidoglycan transpeptidase YkuD (ErfK/YbiS/YcfS/YnhG family)